MGGIRRRQPLTDGPDWLGTLLELGCVTSTSFRLLGEVASTPESVVPDAYALQLHTPAQPGLRLGPAWRQETTDDGYWIIQARNHEPWLANRWPDPHVLTPARAEFDAIIARPTNPLGYLDL